MFKVPLYEFVAVIYSLSFIAGYLCKSITGIVEVRFKDEGGEE